MSTHNICFHGEIRKNILLVEKSSIPGAMWVVQLLPEFQEIVQELCKISSRKVQVQFKNIEWPPLCS